MFTDTHLLCIPVDPHNNQPPPQSCPTDGTVSSEKRVTILKIPPPTAYNGCAVHRLCALKNKSVLPEQPGTLLFFAPPRTAASYVRRPKAPWRCAVHTPPGVNKLAHCREATVQSQPHRLLLCFSRNSATSFHTLRLPMFLNTLITHCHAKPWTALRNRSLRAKFAYSLTPYRRLCMYTVFKLGSPQDD